MYVRSFKKRGMCNLVIRFLLQPSTWVTSEIETTCFVIQEDCQAEWQSWKPPYESEIKEFDELTSFLTFQTILFSQLTSMDTCGDLCPFRVCMKGWQPRWFRIWDQSSRPSFAFPGGRWNYGESYKWWYQPIVQQQLIWRKRCDMWTPMSCGLGMSKKIISKIMIRFRINFQIIIFYYPFLSIRISQIVDGLRVPMFTNSKQVIW